MRKIYTLLITGFFFTTGSLSAEVVDSLKAHPDTWHEPEIIYHIQMFLVPKDSAAAFTELKNLSVYGKQKQKKSYILIANFYKGYYYFWATANRRTEGIEIMKAVVEDVERLEDEKYSFVHAAFLNHLGRTLIRDPFRGFEYLLRSDRILEKIGYEKAGPLASFFLTNIAAVYTYFENHHKSIEYFKKSLEHLDPDQPSKTKAMTYGYIGNAYENIHEDEEALEHYQKGRRIAKEIQDSATMGALSGNIGYIYLKQGRIDLARPMIEEDLEMSFRYDNFISLIAAYFVMAELNLYEKNVEAGEEFIKKGFDLMEKSSMKNFDHFWKLYYKLKAELYRQKQNPENAILYMDSLTQLKDSIAIKKDANVTSGIEALMLAEKYLKDIELYEHEMKREKLIRNASWLILALFILLMGGIIGVLRSRQKRLKQKQQYELIFEKQKYREEIEHYQNKLNAHINGIRQKNQLIQRIQSEAENGLDIEVSEHNKILSRLYQSVILTEDDWKEFRQLFEATHPGFISRLITEYPDLTTSEVRFLVLIKLNFTLAEISSTLGIFPASVRQTRNRLRRKLELDSHKDIVRLVSSFN